MLVACCLLLVALICSCLSCLDATRRIDAASLYNSWTVPNPRIFRNLADMPGAQILYLVQRHVLGIFHKFRGRQLDDSFPTRHTTRRHSNTGTWRSRDSEAYSYQRGHRLVEFNILWQSEGQVAAQDGVRRAPLARQPRHAALAANLRGQDATAA